MRTKPKTNGKLTKKKRRGKGEKRENFILNSTNCYEFRYNNGLRHSKEDCLFSSIQKGQKK